MPNHNEYASWHETSNLIERVEEYARRTGSTMDNIMITAQVDKCLPSRIRKGGCCTLSQKGKLERMMDAKPHGVTKEDFPKKATTSHEIEARRDEAKMRRIRHIENCRALHEARYGQDNRPWAPVEGMLA